MKTFDFIIYGNNTGALVAAAELGKTHKVALVNPAPNWGAHFAGFPLNGENYDIGMNFFEFTTFHQPSNDLMGYDPAVRNDSARFFSMVEKYVTQRTACVEVDKIEVLAEGVFANDVVMANSLDILTKLPSPTLKKIRAEVETILNSADKTYHASQKKKNETLFMAANYYDVSVANHGKTFHDLFVEPFCKKIFNMSSHDCPALLHRIAWAPLFYPETILKGLNGETNLAPTLFHYPAKGYFAAIIEEVMAEIRNNTNIVLINQKAVGLKKTDTFEMQLENETVAAGKLVWCNDLYSFMQTIQNNSLNLNAQKASVSVAFCKVAKSNIGREFSSLYICDQSTPLYRITNQELAAKLNTASTNRVVLELNYDVLMEFGIDSNEKIAEHLNGYLVNAGILKKALAPEEMQVKTLKNAVNLPTLHNFDNFGKLYKLTLELFPGIELIGPASGFVSTSFNDQVVQSMKLAVKYK